MKSLFYLYFLILISLSICVYANDDDEPYQGKYIGKLNSYHHQVSGDVYAVNEHTFLLVDFNYDGNGADTFFWAGASNRPGPQGFIVPDENGKTNILERYFNKRFTLTLPDKKKITEIKWLAVYDLNSQNDFADLYIPEDFEPPATQKLGPFLKVKNNVSCDYIEIKDSKRISINKLSYNGQKKKVYFWAGVGPQPTNKGFKIPNEMGYLDSLRQYNTESIELELPGHKTVFDIDWFSIFDLEKKESYGYVSIPKELNVSPSLVKIINYNDDLPNCLQLHKRFRIAWETFGPQITFQLSGQVSENEYMSFGLSGSDERSQMIGSDVVVAFIDNLGNGQALDYNITSLTPCVQVLGQNKGVCRDDKVGGQMDFQLNTFSREHGVNTISFRRLLTSADHGDKPFELDKEQFVVWALGELDSNNEPTYHNIYPTIDITMRFNNSEPYNDCFSFTVGEIEKGETWERHQILDRSVRTFNAILGPAGAKKGYQGITGHVSNGLAWYINGFLVPELWLRRGLTYQFHVRGGNNPHSAEHYHPLVITDEHVGGYDRLSDVKQSTVRVLAGVEFSLRGKPKPTAAGPLCMLQYPRNYDRRLDDNFITFKKFNRTLKSNCDLKEPPAVLEITPNSSWPDIVYYNSFTHANMGWKIHILDTNRNSGERLQIDSLLLIFFIAMSFLL